jgi:SAM-dependent methyltransferase
VAPSSTSDLYDAIAPVYDEWQAWNGMTPFGSAAAKKLGPLLDREAAARAGGDRPALLDIGCGTGTLLLDVRGGHPDWWLAGVDASAGMLAAARAKLEGASDVAWARATLEDLPLARAFDVCTSFYDTLNHLPDAAALARAFAAAAAVLRPSGLLVFDVTSRRGFEQWWDSSNAFTGDDWAMYIDARYDRRSEVATGNVTFERGGRTRRFRIRERYFSGDAITAALATAGFAVEHEEAWQPFPVGGLGKAWWVARQHEVP